MGTVGELVTRMREEYLDDPAAEDEADNSWKTPLLVAALSASQEEIARRLLLISDATTATVNSIPLCSFSITGVLGVYAQSYAVSRKILKIKQLFYPGSGLLLAQKSMAFFNQFDPKWLGKTGTPTMFCTDYETGKITFNRVPTADGTVTMNVNRLPLARLTSTRAGLALSPEIQEIDDQLIWGALKWAYILDDNHVQDKTAASQWGTAFEKGLSILTVNKAHLSPQVWVTRGSN